MALDEGEEESVLYLLGRERLTFISKSTGCMDSWMQQSPGECGVAEPWLAHGAPHRQEWAKQ